MFLLYPTLRNGEIYFTIFDPGVRQKNIISFYDKHNSNEVKYLEEGIMKVIFLEDSKVYPFKLVSNKRITCQYKILDADINWYFNPYYETLNLDNFNEQLFHAMFSLKLMNFPPNKNNYLCIRSKLLDRTIEIFTKNNNEKILFDDIYNLSLKELENIFISYFKNANLTYDKFDIFVKNIFLLIHNYDEYVNKVIDKNVIIEYNSGLNLNR